MNHINLSTTKAQQLIIHDEEALAHLAQQLAPRMQPGCVIYLKGELGAGKTTLVRFLMRALGYQGLVKSPTYTLVESYDIGSKQIHHFDLYRIHHAAELDYIGIQEYFNQHTICFIEWPAHGEGFLPMADLCCELTLQGDDRQLILTADSPLGSEIIDKL